MNLQTRYELEVAQDALTGLVAWIKPGTAA
jgi:hypothetical protein